ncbi:hypothetical protein HWB05_gp073 [Streptomyces phage BRock]|uniref:Uncharacterized protein n=1 Tax=Streptomyces phage BRock TaxID=1913591 RepID=A0A1J0GVX2_9CAUD|nr:hypothetical protein HWB05_gp073 [Streptomyces phage BRock]APC46335.1 hypothetical protein [Streptomyces phage BRock]
MEIIGYILAPLVVSGGIYHLSKVALDSIWNGILTTLGESGALGQEDVQAMVYHLVMKG